MEIKSKDMILYEEAITDAVMKIRDCWFGKYITELFAVKLGAGRYDHMQLFFSYDEDAKDAPVEDEVKRFVDEIEDILGICEKKDGYWACQIYKTNTIEYLKWQYDLLRIWGAEEPSKVRFDVFMDEGPRFEAVDKGTGAAFEFGIQDLYAVDAEEYGIKFKGSREFMSYATKDGYTMNPKYDIRLKVKSQTDKENNPQEVAAIINGAVKAIVESEFGRKYITKVNTLVQNNVSADYISFLYECAGEQLDKKEASQFARQMYAYLRGKFPLKSKDGAYFLQIQNAGAFSIFEKELFCLWDKERPNEYRALEYLDCGFVISRGSMDLFCRLQDLRPMVTWTFAGIYMPAYGIEVSENSSFIFDGMRAEISISSLHNKWKVWKEKYSGEV